MSRETAWRPVNGRILCGAVGLLAIGAVTTAAAFTDSAEVLVLLDGSQNAFDITTAGSLEDSWDLASADWQQGNPTAYRVKLSDDGSGAPLPPGGSLALSVAVKNSSVATSGRIGLRLVDPDPMGGSRDSDTGAFLELFDQLRFTVKSGSTVIVDGASAEQFNQTAVVWEEEFTAGEARDLDVTISLPYEVDNRWMGASTSVQFVFSGVNT